MLMMIVANGDENDDDNDDVGDEKLIRIDYQLRLDFRFGTPR